MFFASMMLGLVGLIAMTALRMGHGSGSHKHSDSEYAGHGGHGQSDHHESGSSKWLALISPRVPFSLAIGFGAVGLVLEQFLIVALSIPLAIVDAIALERILIQP